MRRIMLTISAVLLLSFLTACEVVTEVLPTESEQDQEGEDWRTWGIVDGYGKLSLDGEEDSPEMWWTFVWDKDDFVYMAALAYPPTEVEH